MAGKPAQAVSGEPSIGGTATAGDEGENDMSETTPTSKKNEDNGRPLTDKELEGVSAGTGGRGGSWQQVQYPDDPPGTFRTVWRPHHS